MKGLEGYNALFCSILRAGLWGRPIELSLSREEFIRIWNDAVKQVCRGLVGSALVSSRSLPPQVVSRLQDHLLAVAGKNLKMDRVLERTVTVLEGEGIVPVLLKGQGVGSCYPDPMLRESGDIDYYVGPDNYKTAFGILAAISDDPESAEFEEDHKHSHLDVDGITIEVHRFSEVLPRRYDPDYQEIARRGLTEGLVPITIEKAELMVPEPTFNAFFIFNHLWRHFVTEGVGFRQLCDWTMFLHANARLIDHDRLKDILKRLDLMRPWKVFGQVAVVALGLPEEDLPFCDSRARKHVPMVVDMIVREGNFGHGREDWWTVPRETFLDNVRVFFMIARRYFGLIPSFGKVVFNEYLSRMRVKFFG